MSYLKKRHNTWYARMGIPEVARPILGRNEFVKSLQTTSRSLAESRALLFIPDWKEQVASAVSDDRLKQEAHWWRTTYHNATTRESIDDVLHALSDRVEVIGTKSSEADAKRFYELATGKTVELADHIEAWFTIRKTEVSEKFAYTSKQRLYRMAERFKLSTDVERKGVVKWIEEQRVKLAVVTVRKIITACDDYWKYLQSRELIEEGQSPFEGHQIKPKAKDSMHKAMQAYRACEVANLHREAVSNRKINLAHAIRIGAYTGCRQDEICKLKVDDIITESGVECLTVRDAKTKAGLRTIPIADQLLPLIYQLRDEAVECGSEYLLQGEVIDKYGKRSRNISKQFTKLKTDMGFGEFHDFHSIRRTVATLLEQAEVEEIHAARLLGHKLKTMSYGLYSGGTSMDVLKRTVDKISYGAGSF